MSSVMSEAVEAVEHVVLQRVEIGHAATRVAALNYDSSCA
jgi:hypothetical protein